MKNLATILTLAVLAAALTTTSVSADRSTRSPVTFKLVSGLPRTMRVGEVYTVTVRITSTQPFTLAQALPDDQFPGKGVNASGGDQSGAGTTATLNVTFRAVSSTADLPGGKDQVAVVAGVRFAGAQPVSQRYEFSVAVP